MAYKFNPFTGKLDLVGPVLTGTGTVSAAADGTEELPGIAFASDLNTGISRPGDDQLAISTDGTGRLFIDASGNVGIGTDSPDALFHVEGNSGSTSPGSTSLLRVESIGSGTDTGIRFKSAGSTYSQIGSIGGDLYAYTDGNERARIDSSGNVGIGTSSPSELLEVDGGNLRVKNFTAGNNITLSTHVGNGNDSTLKFLKARGGNSTPAQIVVGDDLGSIEWQGYDGSSYNEAAQIRCKANTNTGDFDAALVYNADNHVFQNSGSESVRIDDSGRLLVGTSTARTDFEFETVSIEPLSQIESTGKSTALSITRNSDSRFAGTIYLGKSRGETLGSSTVVQDSDRLGSISFNGADGDRLIQAVKIDAEVDGTPGSNNMPGRLVFSTTANGASSPTERMRIQSDGGILFEKTSNSSTTRGFEYRTGAENVVLITNSNAVTASPLIRLNRQSSDGDLISFRHSDTEEGLISVSGTTVTYGGGHLARWSQLPNDEDPSNILKGTVMSNLDEMCEWGEEDNEQLNKTKVSDVEGDPNVAGVFVSTSFSEDGPLDFFVGMTGDMIIRIANGVTVQRGDLLMSAGDGTAKPQEDDIIRSKTIAKVTSTHVTCTYDDGSYCVPCVLMAC